MRGMQLDFEPSGLCRGGTTWPLPMAWRRFAISRGKASERRSQTPRETPKRTMELPDRAIDRRERALLVYAVVLLIFALESPVLRRIRVWLNPILPRAVLDKAPKESKLWFNEGVEPAFAKVWIVPAQGPQIPLTSHGEVRSPPSDTWLPDNLPAGPVVIRFICCPSTATWSMKAHLHDQGSVSRLRDHDRSHCNCQGHRNLGGGYRPGFRGVDLMYAR